MKKAIVIVSILVVIVLCVLCINACDSKEKTDEFMKISTPYCDLYAPAVFEGNVNTEVASEDPYVLTFKAAADNTELFNISFGKESNVLLGTLPLKEGNMVLYASFADIEKGDNYEEYCNYQDGINTIIENLVNDYDFVIDEIVSNEEDVADKEIVTFDVDTKIVKLQYPEKWEEQIDIKDNKDYVEFSADGNKLFDIYFVKCDGYLLGNYNDTPIYIISYELDKKALSDKEYNEYALMQDDVNVIIENLKKDKNFVFED